MVSNRVGNAHSAQGAGSLTLSVRRDVAFATRRVSRAWRSLLAPIGLLSIALACGISMLDILDVMFWRQPAHIAEPSKVLRLYVQEGGQFREWLTNQATVSYVAEGLRNDTELWATFYREQLGIGHGTQARPVEVLSASQGYFDVLGVHPHIGVLPSIRHVYRPEAAVISYSLWQSWFGGATDIVGRELEISDGRFVVAAVTPPGFIGIDDKPVDLWLPLEARQESSGDKEWRTSTTYARFRAVGRLAPGASGSAVALKVSRLVSGFGPHRGDARAAKMTKMTLEAGNILSSRAPGGTIRGRLVVAAAGLAGAVVIAAMGNVIAVLTVWRLRRRDELGLKICLGADRHDVLRELAVESALLIACAGAIGATIAVTAAKVVRLWLLSPAAIGGHGVDQRVVFIASIFSSAVILIGLLALPWRTAALLDASPWKFRKSALPAAVANVLMALQVAVTVPLAAGAILFGLSLLAASRADLGVDAHGVAVVSVSMPTEQEQEQRYRTYRRIASRAEQVQWIKSVAVVQAVPFRGGSFVAVSTPSLTDGRVLRPLVNGVDSSYFDTLKIGLRSGRLFSAAEGKAGARPLAIVNQEFAREVWGREDVIGQCVVVIDVNKCSEIIGVVNSTPAFASIRGEAAPVPIVYVPIEQSLNILPGLAILVRTATDGDRQLLDLRTLAQAESGVRLASVDWLDSAVKAQTLPLRRAVLVLAVFSGLGMLAVCCGVVAVIGHAVDSRTHEMAVELALGRDERSLVRSVVAKAGGAVAIGMVVGTAAAVGLSTFVRGLVVGVSVLDVRVFTVASAAVGVAATLGAYASARRVRHVDPIVLLKRGR